jgi:flagellar FliL protein
MAKEKTEKDPSGDAPKKSKKKLMIIVIAVVVLLGGGGGAYFMLKGGKAKVAPPPEKGVVVAIEDALTINLTDGHFLKLGFALQMTAAAGAEAIDTSEALNLAIDEYTGKTVAELSTEKGRDTAKAALLAKIEEAYKEKEKQMIMDIYYTSFVTQ